MESHQEPDWDVFVSPEGYGWCGIDADDITSQIHRVEARTVQGVGGEGARVHDDGRADIDGGSER